MAGTRTLNIVFMILGIIGPLAIILFVFDRYPTGGWTYAGLAIFFPSLILWAIAHIQLGRSFTVRARAQELVTNGIYSKVRHPIYVFGFLVLLSLVVCARRPEWLVLLALLVPVQLRRVRNEERALEAKFGQAYVEYKRRTWF